MACVSIIILCFNAMKYLPATLESVYSQKGVDCEVVAVDDGSTDGTRDFLESCGAKIRAHYIEHRGASAARNIGTKNSKAEFIQYLVADDLLRPRAIERRVNALLESGADVAYSDWQYLVEKKDGSFLPGRVIYRRIEDIHPDPQIALFTDFWAPPAALLYRRRIVDLIGGWNISLSIIQDARFLLDAALCGAKFAHVSEIGADYRDHRSDSLSKRDSIEFIKDILVNADQVHEWWNAHASLNNERLKALMKVYGYVARSSIKKNTKLFDLACERLMELDPKYIPKSSRALAAASAWFGYKNAEYLAFGFRFFKKLTRFGRKN